MYFGQFNERADIFSNFNIEDNPSIEILYANYDGGGYDGSAFVLFRTEGKLYEVNGGHCSCYGLEDQWGPEETSWQALAIRKWSSSEYSSEARTYIDLLITREISRCIN